MYTFPEFGDELLSVTTHGLSSENGFGDVVVVNTGRQLELVSATEGNVPWQT